jgi:hypothetical protein
MRFEGMNWQSADFADGVARELECAKERPGAVDRTQTRQAAHGIVRPSEKNGFHSHSSSRSFSLTSGKESGRQVMAGSRPMPREMVLSQQ